VSVMEWKEMENISIENYNQNGIIIENREKNINDGLISIIIPTYNEKENIGILIDTIHKVLKGYNYELIVVDDNSPDGTAKIAEELSKLYPIRVLKRSGKLGLASAILDGFQHSRGKILGVIDADLQHPPEYIKNFIYSVSNGHDIAVGSRYAKGGSIDGWSAFRKAVSRGAIALSMPLTNVMDPVSGYFFIKKKVIENTELNPIGYKILLEILVKGSYNKVQEIPYTFKLRENGKSKLGIGEYINYTRHLYGLYGYKLNKKLLGR
jgi:dolichol-phosphate mannosyltransferase